MRSIGRLLSILAVVLGSIAVTEMAFAHPDDPVGNLPDCSDESKYLPNSWILVVNNGDQSSRRDLLGTFQALSTGGFSLQGLYPIDPAFVVVTSFDPSYYGDDTKSAVHARDFALQTLVQAQGVVVECNGIVIPFPGITIRN